MINYFKIPELLFSSKDLYDCFIINQQSWASYGSSDINSLHTKYADQTAPAIQYIVNQFKDPNIIENIKFFKTKAGGEVNAHSDKRNVAINIPVQTNEDSSTIFYKNVGQYDNPDLSVNGKNITVKAKRYNKVERTESFVLYHAVCLNTSIPHGVTNQSDQDRIILSISFKEQYDNFYKIKQLYDEGNLTRTK